MNLNAFTPFAVSFLLVCAAPRAEAAPPFQGTIFLDPDIITADDPTSYAGLVDAGQGTRWMFDRRFGWVQRNAYLFMATYSGGPQVEVQVNPEFETVDLARAEALKYAPVIGRLPVRLLKDLQTVWIHRGMQPFGGGNNNLLIHTGQAEQYIATGILEETLVHEAAHTSLDSYFASAPGWLAAQAADGEFISTYARDNPTREDIAESFLPWLAVRHRRDRISESLANTILQTIPNRIAFFDAQRFAMRPVVGPSPFKQWMETHPAVSQNRPGSDPDGDGIPNLLEFALNGNPAQPNSAAQPTSSLWASTPGGAKDRFAFAFNRRSDSIPEVDLIFQHSVDLQNWTDIKIEIPPTPGGPVALGPVVGGLQAVTVTLPTDPAGPKRFGRLKASGSVPSGNLLQNGSGESPPGVGWTIIASGGDGWARSSGIGYDGVPGYFITSYGWCRRSQLVDLVAAGFTPAALDAAPRIRVQEAISSYPNNQPDSFYIRVELRDQNQNVIASWNAGTFAAPLLATDKWVLHQHEFTNYGPSVRYVYFEDGGIDRGFWAGPFGTYHDAASVEVFPR
jgi:hypothetical protein